MKNWFPRRREQKNRDDVVIDDPRCAEQEISEITAEQEADGWSTVHDADAIDEDDDDCTDDQYDDEFWAWADELDARARADRDFRPGMHDERVCRESRLYYLDDDPECPF